MRNIFKSINTYLQFIALSFLLTLLLLFAFYNQTGKPENVVGFFYILSIPFYYYFILFLIGVFLSPLTLFTYLNYLIIIPKIVLDVFLLTDIFVFNIYRFHIDMMFINMTIHDFSGIGLSPSIIILTVISFIVIIFLNFWVFKKVKHKFFLKTKILNLVLLFIFLFGQLIHIWANEYKQQFVTKYTPYFPYYFPVTSSSIMTKLKNNYPKIIPLPIEEVKNDLGSIFQKKSNKEGIFKYPIKPLVFNDSLQNKPNILFFLTESWRADMLTSEVTPNIKELSKTSYEYTNHYSGGSVTVTGLFSLMYGLHPSYLKYAQADSYRYQSVFTRSLEQMGYTIGAYTSSNLDRFALKPMFFGVIESKDYINQRALSVVENDRYVVSQLIDDIYKSEKDKPWFKFVFLDSSHHNYKYPPEHEIYTPVPKNSEGFVFNKNIDSEPFLNDYKNSLHYIDALFKDIYNALIQSGLDKNTIIVITSDHGEEFNDNKKGYWGHGSNFTSYQTAVPLVLKLPNSNEHLVVKKRSGHVDIVSTLLTQILKCENNSTDFSSGYNLLDLPDKRGLISASYTDKAYLIDDKVYANGLFFKSYFINNISLENEKFDYELINLLRKEETNFLIE